MIAFRVGGPDGETLEKVFRPNMMQSHHFLNLKKHEVIASIPEGSSAPIPFLGMTLAPLQYEAGRKDAIIALSREKYARPRSIRWLFRSLPLLLEARNVRGDLLF